MKISGEDYQVSYDSATATLTCQGILRLYGMEGYAAIEKLFMQVADQKPATIILNLRTLEMLNSPGINVLSNFVIKVSQSHVSQLIIQGSVQLVWQIKVLKNLQRLMSELKIEFE